MQLRKETYSRLTPVQRLQVARHPNRPTCLDIILNITDKFVELHGDRAGLDDPAIVCGIGSINGTPFMMIGHQKGRNTKAGRSKLAIMRAGSGAGARTRQRNSGAAGVLRSTSWRERYARYRWFQLAPRLPAVGSYKYTHGMSRQRKMPSGGLEQQWLRFGEMWRETLNEDWLGLAWPHRRASNALPPRVFRAKSYLRDRQAVDYRFWASRAISSSPRPVPRAVSTHTHKHARNPPRAPNTRTYPLPTFTLTTPAVPRLRAGEHSPQLRHAPAQRLPQGAALHAPRRQVWSAHHHLRGHARSLCRQDRGGAGPGGRDWACACALWEAGVVVSNTDWRREDGRAFAGNGTVAVGLAKSGAEWKAQVGQGVEEGETEWRGADAGCVMVITPVCVGCGRQLPVHLDVDPLLPLLPARRPLTPR